MQQLVYYFLFLRLGLDAKLAAPLFLWTPFTIFISTSLLLLSLLSHLVLQCLLLVASNSPRPPVFLLLLECIGVFIRLTDLLDGLVLLGTRLLCGSRVQLLLGVYLELPRYIFSTVEMFVYFFLNQAEFGLLCMVWRSSVNRGNKFMKSAGDEAF